MTKNELKRASFGHSLVGKLLTLIELPCLMIIMAIVMVYFMQSVVPLPEKEEHFLLVSMVIMVTILGLFISSHVPYSMFFWWILPMNKKSAKKFIARQKKDLEKKIADRDELIKATEEKYHKQIIIIDEEVTKNKTLLEELVKIEQSL